MWRRAGRRRRARDQAPLGFGHLDAARREVTLEHPDRGMRLAAAAHEDVDRRIAALGPGVDRDMRLGEHRHARDAAAIAEVMKEEVEQRRPAILDGVAQGRVDRRDAVERIRVPQLDEQMGAGVFEAVFSNEIVRCRDPIFGRCGHLRRRVHRFPSFQEPVVRYDPQPGDGDVYRHVSSQARKVYPKIGKRCI